MREGKEVLCVRSKSFSTHQQCLPSKPYVRLVDTMLDIFICENLVLIENIKQWFPNFPLDVAAKKKGERISVPEICIINKKFSLRLIQRTSNIKHYLKKISSKIKCLQNAFINEYIIFQRCN